MTNRGEDLETCSKGARPAPRLQERVSGTCVRGKGGGKTGLISYSLKDNQTCSAKP